MCVCVCASVRASIDDLNKDTGDNTVKADMAARALGFFPQVLVCLSVCLCGWVWVWVGVWVRAGVFSYDSMHVLS